MKKHEAHDAPAAEQEQTELTPPEARTPEEEIAHLESLLASKEAEAKENWDRFVRERADLENYRKRANREKEELLNYGIKALVEEILPVVDNLERALLHSNEDDLTAVVEGIRMTHTMLLGALKKFGVVPVEAVGTPFDPAFHQAMSQVPTDQQPPNTVVQEFQKGYLLKERLLRPAMVSVATAV